ncbi:MAG: ankyrin repeat domain-containing protein, partial [Clostridia bacterium]|nr:ankyrin repeat domain-containing protein [Clostridia bacterium]
MSETEKLNQELIRACEAGKLEDVVRLLDQGADVNYRDRLDNTPLQAASGNNGNSEVVNYLILRGADVQQGDPDDCLWDACVWGYIELVRLCVKKG